MEDKIEREFLRQELADYLENLARQVRSGSFLVQGTQWGMPERLETKIELKEKKGRVNAKVRFRWTVLNEYDEKTRAKMVRQQEDFKELKKQLAEVFGELLKSAEQEVFPAESKVMKFVELSKEFFGLTDPDWESEMQEYLDHVENLHLALKNKQIEMFHHELRDLKVRVKACHQEYR
ncbi:MAG: GAK system XXXCH domain-containing protein [Deltaproteobacteria bacterium]|nr:GAK system XXXCH domain-containing protein [Deltaproteobacteria bacterium]